MSCGLEHCEETLKAPEITKQVHSQRLNLQSVTIQSRLHTDQTFFPEVLSRLGAVGLHGERRRELYREKQRDAC